MYTTGLIKYVPPNRLIGGLSCDTRLRFMAMTQCPNNKSIVAFAVAFAANLFSQSRFLRGVQSFSHSDPMKYVQWVTRLL